MCVLLLCVCALVYLCVLACARVLVRETEYDAILGCRDSHVRVVSGPIQSMDLTVDSSVVRIGLRRMRACASARACVCGWVYVCACLRAFVYVCLRACVCMCGCARMHLGACACACACVCLRTCVHMCVLALQLALSTYTASATSATSPKVMSGGFKEILYATQRGTIGQLLVRCALVWL